MCSRYVKVLTTHDLAVRLEALEFADEKGNPMTRDLRKRIRKLKFLIPRRPNEQDVVFQFIRASYCAYRLLFGEPTENDLIASACARGLGYPRPFEFRNGLGSHVAGLNERFALANTRLLAKFGVNKNNDWDAICGAYARMERGLPESYKRKLYRE